MARIIYGALVESIRGSIGGTTFQRNAYGYTVKKKPNMIKPNTSWQQAQKIYFSQAVTAWNALTAAQRADWDSWASTYPQYAKYNPTSQLSGYAVFVRTHCYRFMAGLPVDTNPTFTTFAAATATISLEVAGGALTLVATDTNGNEDYRIMYFFSRPFSGSQNFIGTKTRFFTEEPSVGALHWDVTAAWQAKFGTIPAVGQLVAWRVVFFGDGNGQVLAAQEGIDTVIAHV